MVSRENNDVYWMAYELPGSFNIYDISELGIYLKTSTIDFSDRLYFMLLYGLPDYGKPKIPHQKPKNTHEKFLQLIFLLTIVKGFYGFSFYHVNM